MEVDWVKGGVEKVDGFRGEGHETIRWVNVLQREKVDGLKSAA